MKYILATILTLALLGCSSPGVKLDSDKSQGSGQSSPSFILICVNVGNGSICEPAKAGVVPEVFKAEKGITVEANK